MQDFHALLFTALVFLGDYNYTSSSLLCAYKDFHMICIKEIDSWFLWCPRNPWRLRRAFVQECEISKSSHEPRPDFSLFLLNLCTVPRTFLICPTLGSSRILERLWHFFPSLWSPEELSQHHCNLLGQPLPQCWCYSALVSLGKGLKKHFVSQPSRMSPLFGHEGSSEPSVLFPGVWKNRRCSQCTSCLGTPCLCEQKERWRTPCLKRNPISIINEGVPMEKNIVLISLLDISKALVIALSEFLIVCSSLSESRWIFSWFSVTQCHPLIFPAALCPLSCSMLCCVLTSASCIPLHITDIISLYFVNYCPWVILFPFLFCSRLPSLIWSGPFPSLLTFGSLFADRQHVYLTQCLFPFFISSNSSLFPCSFFLTTISSCFSALFPLWSQPAHHLGVPDLG